MRKALLILVVILLGAYFYMQHNTDANAEKDQDPVVQEEVSSDEDVDTDDESVHDDYTEEDIGPEYDDMYEQGTGEREVYEQDYGVGDMGETSLD